MIIKNNFLRLIIAILLLTQQTTRAVDWESNVITCVLAGGSFVIGTLTGICLERCLVQRRQQHQVPPAPVLPVPRVETESPDIISNVDAQATNIPVLGYRSDSSQDTPVLGYRSDSSPD